MNIVEVQDNLKNFSQDQLINEINQPSGMVPQFLVLTELGRRNRIKQDMEGRQAQNQPTVAQEVVSAITKGTEDAKKNLYRIPVVNGTIPHEQNGKFGGSRIFMRPASHGTGVIAGGAMRAVIESVGVKDILAKSKGSSNPHNVVKATMDALLQLRDARTVASQRGISMSKVFNAK